MVNNWLRLRTKSLPGAGCGSDCPMDGATCYLDRTTYISCHLAQNFSNTMTNQPSLSIEPGARVVVAMSGGVDSSVAAALCKEAGYDAVGITLQLYDNGAARGRKGACCAGQDILDARRVADALAIPHYVLDYEARFRNSVVEPFADSYLAGETPIPCVACNQTVKFRDLLATAKELGAACLVTGHYVRRVAGDSGPELHRARDRRRDQSYFLFGTTRDQLDFLRFPLGDLDKDETRDRARAYDLPVAAKPDSQDICFVPNGRYADVIAKLRPGAGEPGEIVDTNGHALGRHDGIIHYTVGQRRGLGLGGGDALYVVRLEPATNRIVVGFREALEVDRIRVRDVNWLSDTARDTGSDGVRATIKIRSTQAGIAGRVIDLGGNAADVSLEGGEAGVSPGQACVFYDDDRVLGGGWIASTSAVLDRTAG